jgi:hypothetical protein
MTESAHAAARAAVAAAEAAGVRPAAVLVRDAHSQTLGDLIGDDL